MMMTDKLYRLPQCVRLCRYAVRIERLNIAIPVILKLLQTFVAPRLTEVTKHLPLRPW